MSDRDDPARDAGADHDLEQWLARQLPSGPPAELDRRLLEEARSRLASSGPHPQAMPGAGPQRGPASRGRRWLAAAALLVIAVLAGWLMVERDRDRRSSDSGSGRDALIAAGGGRFELGPGTRSRVPAGSGASRLQLIEGSCTAYAVRMALAIDFPGGSLRVVRGTGQVTIWSEREHVMERTGGRWQKGAVVVALAIAAGWGSLELVDDTQEVKAGEERRLYVEPAGDGAAGGAGWKVEELPDDGAGAALGAGAGERGNDIAEADPQPGEADATKGGADDESSELPPVHGIVVDAATGEPIEGVRLGWVERWIPIGVGSVVVRSPKSTTFVQQPTMVRIGNDLIDLPLQPGLQTSLRVETLTDAEGAFTLPGPLSDNEFLMATVDGAQPWFGKAPADPETTLEIALEAQRRVTGRLVASGGGPVRGIARNMNMEATYDLPNHEGWRISLPVLLADDLTFEVRLGSIERVRLEVQAPGYHDLERLVAVPPGGTQLTLVLEEHPHLTGRVTDPAGRPLAGANLLVKSGKRGLFGDRMNHVSTTTDEDGRYIANLYGPTIEISAQREGYLARDFEEASGDAPFDIVLEPAVDGRLRGAVLDDRGLPVAGAEVRATQTGIGVIRSYRTRTDERGEFSYEELPPGAYDLRARPRVDGQQEIDRGMGPEPVGAIHAGVEKQGIGVESGQETDGIELVIPVGGVIEGLFLAEDGSPGAGERIALYRPDLLGGDHELLASIMTDASGRFAFHGIPRGTYAVAVERLGTYKIVRASLDEPVRVQLGGEAFALHGRILRDGEPVGGAPIALGRFGEAGIDSRMDRTDDDGSYHFEGLASGRYLMHVRDPRSGTVLLHLEEVGVATGDLELVWPGTVVTVELAGDPVPVGTELTLDVLEVGGITLAGQVPPAYLRVASARTEDGTTFRFEGISPARYRLGGQAGDRTLQAEFEVGDSSRTVRVP